VSSLTEEDEGKEREREYVWVYEKKGYEPNPTAYSTRLFSHLLSSIENDKRPIHHHATHVAQVNNNIYIGIRMSLNSCRCIHYYFYAKETARQKEQEKSKRAQKAPIAQLITSETHQ
jgi:hypothetical protein